MLLKKDKNSYFILSMMYLSGIRPSWPLTDPFHQSFDTCLDREMVSPLWKLTSLVDLAVKSYNAWASKVSDSEEESRGKFIRFQRHVGTFITQTSANYWYLYIICRSCLIIWLEKVQPIYHNNLDVRTCAWEGGPNHMCECLGKSWIF